MKIYLDYNIPYNILIVYQQKDFIYIIEQLSTSFYGQRFRDYSSKRYIAETSTNGFSNQITTQYKITI